MCMGSYSYVTYLSYLRYTLDRYKYYLSYVRQNSYFDLFTKINFTYKNAVASLKVGKGVKSEGELVISGTKGYIYVPHPGGKLNILKLGLKIKMIIEDTFIHLKEKGFVMN